MDPDPSLLELSALVSRTDGRIDLARASLAIARWEYPRLDADAYLERLDGLARSVDTDNLQSRATIWLTGARPGTSRTG